jgi:hypothetical protein
MCLFIVGLVGCYSDPSEKVIGAWKSKKVNPLSRKLETVIFDKKTVRDSSYDTPIPVEYEERDGFIYVKRLSDNEVVYTIVIQGDELGIDGGVWGTRGMYVRTTIEDVDAIISAP